MYKPLLFGFGAVSRSIRFHLSSGSAYNGELRLGSRHIARGVRGFSTNLKADNFLDGSSSVYVEDMFRQWEKDPSSVHPSWNSYFRNRGAGLSPSESYQSPPSLGSYETLVPPPMVRAESKVEHANMEKFLRDHLSVQTIIRSYQVMGHRVADIDPLHQDGRTQLSLPEMQLETYQLGNSVGESDLDRYFALPVTTFIGGQEKILSLREIVKRLKAAYCGSIGLQYMFIPRRDMSDWIRSKFEVPGALNLLPEEKRLILRRLLYAASLEDFLLTKWPAEKRFGLEGCESLIPALGTVIDTSQSMGVESFVMGMAHRGRLNVVANICQTPLDRLFVQFLHLEPGDDGTGDVKYHLGTSRKFVNEATGLPMKISLCANPSHLETVDPVVQGKTRAEQFSRGDAAGDKVMSIIMHGDAAFAGQGVVYETFHLSALPDYTTNGTIHVVINNQVGFTTDPRVARSSPYCTDVARVVNAPIFHVNADDPEAVHYVARVAALWRATFHRDVVIDLIGYRRYGHNEMDEPKFTQPTMYDTIRNHMIPVAQKYATKLVEEGVVDRAFVEAEIARYIQHCDASYKEASKEVSVRSLDWVENSVPPDLSAADVIRTGVDEHVLQHIATIFSTEPTEIAVHNGVKRILKGRRDLQQEGIANWAMGEAFAWGSLLMEGIHVRLSGQDVERGTFSHRHHVLHCQVKDKTWVRPLCQLSPNQATYTVCNSSLSEYGVLGFEHGYSMGLLDALVMWEAQFGDFNNTGQPIIDQCISSGEAKWNRQSGIVMLLPHGYEGMGPEHSSARLERFLQLSDDDPNGYLVDPSPSSELNHLKATNWQVMNLTTPANYFHAMRRQVKLPFRKPLVMMTPKSLLNLPTARSSFDEFLPGTHFERIYPDDGAVNEDPSRVKRLVFCTGKVYYELQTERDAKKLNRDIALVRIEQICPFPYDLVKEQLILYPNASVIWAQEEHKNSGAWTFIQPRIGTVLKEHLNDPRYVTYTGRAVSASTATGNKKQHLAEQAQLILDTLRLE